MIFLATLTTVLSAAHRSSGGWDGSERHSALTALARSGSTRGTGSSLNITGNISISAWVKLNLPTGVPEPGASEVVGGGYDGTNTAYELQVQRNIDGGKMACDTFRNPTTHGVVSATTPSRTTFQLWDLRFRRHELVVIFEWRIGRNECRLNWPYASVAAPKTIGGLRNSGSSSYLLWCRCTIDDVRIWNVALTPTQIASLLCLCRSPQAPNLATLSARYSIIALIIHLLILPQTATIPPGRDDDKIYVTHNDLGGAHLKSGVAHFPGTVATSQ